ncbi:hypothetical protein NUACC26_083320 [Scytonema sp. NUACC26]
MIKMARSLERGVLCFFNAAQQQVAAKFSTYQETEPVFFAVHDGGLYIFRLIIHWKRDVVQREHTTVIDWEIVNNQHYQTTIKSDNSTFPAHNLEELNYLFKNLLSSET